MRIMIKKISEILPLVFKKYRFYARLLIYVCSWLIAVCVSAMAFIKASDFLFIIILINVGIIGALIHFLLYKKFSKRFIVWAYPTKFHFWGRINYGAGIFLIPPISSFVMSIALFIFGYSFFDPRIKNFWMGTFTGGSMFIVEAVSIYLVFVTFMIVFFSVSCWCLSSITEIEKGKKVAKNFFSIKFLVLIFIANLIFYIIFLYIARVGIYSITAQPLYDLTAKILILLLGFIPFHWFYELFVGSICPEIRDYLYTETKFSNIT